MLTGRRDKIDTIRQKGRLHPFPWRGESEYDVLTSVTPRPDFRRYWYCGCSG
ncbi:1-deoxy-D-xylulose-5-phosphate synthase N-terminal domain-containing protein [Shigella flexneri]